jgi:predicted acetylornithine/succinylornithine family transaminase
MKKEQIIQDEASYLVQTYVRPEIVFERGEGAYLYDTDGNRYLDFMAGIAVNALGHADPEWVEAVCDQAGRLTHVSNLFHTRPHVQLAERLVENSFADRVFFSNSGSEANETALKFARKYARTTSDADGKTKIVAFSGGFHGRTMGALSTTYKNHYREPFAPLVPDVHFGTFNNVSELDELIDESTCAVIVEPVQGEGGINAASPEFLQEVRARCDQYGTLLIFDEVQCGLGRTGTLWAHQHYAVEPDIMTLAKPLAGGLPIGAVLVREEIAAVIAPGDHGSTFAAGPLVCRAAQVVFDRVSNPAFLQHVRETGDYLQGQLGQLDAPSIKVVRGKGLLVGIELSTAVRPLMQAARDEGLLIINAGENVIRLCPPLIINKEQVDEAVAILSSCLDFVESAV